MVRVFRSVYLVILLGSIAILAIPALSQEKTIKKVPAAPTTAVDGRTLFKQYCAACHGISGKGDGPAADALKRAPGDLTQFAKQNGGRFPEEKFMRILQGDEAVTAHGSQEMPVWGAVFQKSSSNPSMTQMRLHSLLEFVESIQAK